MTPHRIAIAGLTTLLALGCGTPPTENVVRVSGYVEADEVRVAPKIGGRLTELSPREGDTIGAGIVVARFETIDLELARQQARAERRQAEASLRLLEAGTRAEDLEQARAGVARGRADLEATRAELRAAEADVDRFESLVQADAGSRRQRDDALTRRDVWVERVRAAAEAVRSAEAALAGLVAGARREELEAARARVDVVEARLSALEHELTETVVRAPIAGVVTEVMVQVGELVPASTPMLVLTDLDRAWATVFLDEPLVPRIRLGQPARVLTDAGQALEGDIVFVSPRAEFTPRNVQTADERAKLVYRIKVRVDNRSGILKPGMPIEVETELEAPPPGP